MAAIEPRLIEKLEKLPRERLSEVEDFVEFLAAREERAASPTAGRREDSSLLGQLRRPPPPSAPGR
jgi:hypothetical protein